MARQAERVAGSRFPLSGKQLILLVLIVAGGGLLGWQGYRQVYGDGSVTKAPPVTYTVQTQPLLQQTATTSGNVNAPANAKLTFAQAGRVATVAVKQGQTVHKGDVIATLDPTTLQVAVQQAQSQVNTAQATLDALNNPATPDVVAAAQAGVTSAQAGQVAAQSTLDQARNSAVAANTSIDTASNGVTTAQNTVQSANTTIAQNQTAIGTASNGVLTAQNAVQTAQNTIAQNQAAVQTAQNNYQALLNGPTPQQIAVAQASVGAAATSLQTAQDNYNRLVNHTDIATRPETQALITASAAYQSALANLANAQPQPVNPYDVQAAQLAVQNASNAVSAAQTAAQTAQTSLLTAEQNAACNSAPLLDASLCPPGTAANQPPNALVPGQVITLGNSAIFPPPQPQNPSPQTTQAAQQAATTAQNAANSAAATVITAQGNYQTALNALQKVLNPVNTTNLGGLQGAVAAAQSNLDIARTNYNNYLSLPDLAVRTETTALNTAQSAYNTATANYNQAVAPAKDTDLATAQNAITTAQAQLDSARAAEKTAETAVGTAQNGVSTAQDQVTNAGIAANTAETAVGTAQNAVNTAQQSANSAGSTINTAASGINTAAANTTSAQKKLDQLKAAPLQTDATKAAETVNQAKQGLQTAQYNLSNATLAATFDGTIAAVSVNPGDQVTAGTQIAQLVDTGRVELDAQVDETTYGQIKVGLPVQAQFDSVPDPARPGTDLTFTGFVTAIVPSGTTAQGVVTYPIVITLNPNVVMPPNGATASVIRLVLSAKQNVVAIPGRYLYRNAQGNQVVDLYQNGKRVPTTVTTGLATDTLTEITSGLRAGDAIAQPQVAKAAAGSKSGSAFGSGSGVPGLGGGGTGGGAAPAAGRGGGG